MKFSLETRRKVCLSPIPCPQYLNESSHLPALFPVPRGVVEDDVGCPDSLPGQAGVGDVVVVGRVPHQEHVVPLGDDLAVGGQGLGSLVLNISPDEMARGEGLISPCPPGGRGPAGGSRSPRRGGWRWGGRCSRLGSYGGDPLIAATQLSLRKLSELLTLNLPSRLYFVERCPSFCSPRSRCHFVLRLWQRPPQIIKFSPSVQS